MILGALPLAACGDADALGPAPAGDSSEAALDAAALEEENNEHGPTTGPVKTAFLPNVQGNIVEYRYREAEGLAVSGDMVLGTVEQIAEMEKGIWIKDRVWPRRTLVYAWHSSLLDNKTNGTGGTTADDANTIAEIKQAMADWTASTGLIFRERVNENDYVRFEEHTTMCWAAPGKVGGAQIFQVKPACTTGNMRHELGHSFGLEHEHQSCNAADEIIFLWDNIQDDLEYAYEDLCDSSHTTYLNDVDFGSLMIYGSKTSDPLFAVDPSKPVMTKNDAAKTQWTSQRAALSANDIKTIKKLYSKFEYVKTSVALYTEIRAFADNAAATRICTQNGYASLGATATRSVPAGSLVAEWSTATNKWEARNPNVSMRVYTSITCNL